jgi:zinc protease
MNVTVHSAGDRPRLRVVSVALTLLVASQVNAQGTPDRSAPPKPGPAKPFAILMPTEFKLKNGVKVLLIERKRAPLVDVVATIDAGISADPKELPGLAGWTADMLTEGAGDLDAIAFSDAVGALGARIDAGAEPENAFVSLHATSARFGEAMKLFALALTKPRFDDKDWKRVRQQTFGYFMYQSQEPQELASLAGSRENWGADHRFGWNLRGTPAALVATKTSDLRAFHAARYRPDTTTLVVVGDVDRKTVTRVLEETLGAWTATGAAPAKPKLAGPVELKSTRVVAVQVPSAAQTVLRVQTPAPADIQPFTADVEVMNTLLGGSFTSRLNSNLRERNGYSYGAGSRVGMFSFGNFFMVRTSVATAKTAPALREVMNELERMKGEPATDEEAERARNLAALSMPSAFDNGEGTAGFWADIVARNTDASRVQRYMSDALQVDPKAMHAAAKRVMQNGNWTVVAVGDIAKVGKELEPFGARTTLTVDDLMPGLQEAMAALQSSE